MKSYGRPCPVCCGPTRTVEVQQRKGYTYRRHRCRNWPECLTAWASRQYHGDVIRTNQTAMPRTIRTPHTV